MHQKIRGDFWLWWCSFFQLIFLKLELQHLRAIKATGSSSCGDQKPSHVKLEPSHVKLEHVVINSEVMERLSQ
ncbi:uncharacterized protein BJ212DRAFT_1412321 [Suillus subaureus]|uniref:Uncharacterized protein n=1 Tax=Suillus subaureus TaxID=48587 RepID=A0A9P7DIB4_9AGAM|nr:uncharacterized protein BJ212DRAFT_1412321 [Suillus subaureus]KAG1794725.1 hypothetical protein BJ212DRAFT_1412321 [Suillus subaureus]